MTFQSDREKVMKIRPLSDRIVVRRFEAQETTKGGILLPDSAKNKPQKGKVLATGAGHQLSARQHCDRVLDSGNEPLGLAPAHGHTVPQARHRNRLIDPLAATPLARRPVLRGRPRAPTSRTRHRGGVDVDPGLRAATEASSSTSVAVVTATPTTKVGTAQVVAKSAA